MNLQKHAESGEFVVELVPKAIHQIDSPEKEDNPFPYQDNPRHRLAASLGITSKYSVLFHSAHELQKLHKKTEYILGNQLDQEKQGFPVFLLCLMARGYNVHYLTPLDPDSSESDVACLFRLLRDESAQLAPILPLTASALLSLSSLYSGQQQKLCSSLGPSFWTGLIDGGMNEIMTRPFEQSQCRDGLSTYDQQHALTLGLARAEFASIDHDIPGSAKDLCYTIAQYHSGILKGTQQRDVGFTTDLLHGLETELYRY